MNNSKMKSTEKAKAFIRIWYKCKSVQEVADKLDVSTATVYGRQNKLRKLGIELKSHSMMKHPLFDIRELNELNEELKGG